MAYSFSATVAAVGVYRGRQHYLVTVTESDVAGSSDEWSITLASYDLPRVGVVKVVECTFTGGSATTVDPEAGMHAGGSDVYANGTAGASPLHFHPATGLIWPDSGTLYGQSKANGAATTIVTKLLVAEGTDD